MTQNVSLPTASNVTSTSVSWPGPEARLTPAKDEPVARLPNPDAAHLEDGAVRQRLGEASALTRLEGKRAGRARRKLKQRIRRPPQRDVAGKYLEGARARL
jgi:hypothetical protein